MPTLLQPVRDYSLTFEHTRGTAQPTVHSRTRFIHVRFGTDVNNLNLLILGFIADAPSATTGDIVKVANGTYRVSARIPVGEFPAYTDLLRNEQPVSVRIDYKTEPAAGQSVVLDSFAFFTGTEPPGEGPRDTSA